MNRAVAMNKITNNRMMFKSIINDLIGRLLAIILAVLTLVALTTSPSATKAVNEAVGLFAKFTLRKWKKGTL